MTRNEALKACIDGAKVTQPQWEEGYCVEFREDNCSFNYGLDRGMFRRVTSELDYPDGYEIYEEKESGEIEELDLDISYNLNEVASHLNELVRAVNKLRKEK